LLQNLIDDARITQLVARRKSPGITEKYMQQNMEFTQREWQAAPAARSAPGIDQAAALLTVIRAPSACVIDFFEARNRLLAGFEASSEAFEIKRTTGNVAARRIPSVGRFDRLEESLYWLLSAAMLIYLVLEIIGH